MNKSLVYIILAKRKEAIKLAQLILRFFKSDKFSMNLISTDQYTKMVAEVANTFKLKIYILI